MVNPENGMLDKHCSDLIDNSINMTVPWYLMAAYAYYVEDDPFYQIASLIDWQKRC